MIGLATHLLSFDICRNLRNNRRHQTLAAICLLLTLIGDAGARDISMVTVDWAPYYGKDLENGGVMTELVQAAFARGGHNATVKFMSWTRALKLVEEGDEDIVMGAYFNADRDKKYIFSRPFYKVTVGLIARQDVGFETFNSLEDLKAYRIGVSRGFANSEAFDSASFLNKDVAKSPSINLQKLERNRIDMMAAAFGIFRYEVKRAGSDSSNFTYVEPPLAEHLLYLMGSRRIPDGEQIVNDFNRGMLELLEDGTISTILRKYGF